MCYDTTKPLGDQLREYISKDLPEMSKELLYRGIVYESQFRSLHSMVCKQNASELTTLFGKETGLSIRCGYDTVSCMFYFYDEDKYSQEEALHASLVFQESQGY